MLTVILAIAVLLGAVLLYAATKPGSCQFSRSIHILAPPERIFPLINDLRAMNEWNPFVKADPNIRLSYSGPASGAGAANDFDGNGQVGSGRVEIVESVPPSKIIMALHMVRPMKCQNRVEFTITPCSDGADVTWGMSGRQPFIGKLMSVFINTGKMVGGAFETGLTELKAKAETCLLKEKAPMTATQKVRPCLWFDHEAEEAANFYISLIPNSRILDIAHYGEAGPGKPGSVLMVSFELAGVQYLALNGGPVFKFTEAISLSVDCASQAEIDSLWEKLGEGGEYSRCGWLKDRYGLSWQIVPSRLPELLNGADKAGAKRAMEAMLQMSKLDIAMLEMAYAGQK